MCVVTFLLKLRREKKKKKRFIPLRKLTDYTYYLPCDFLIFHFLNVLTGFFTISLNFEFVSQPAWLTFRPFNNDVLLFICITMSCLTIIFLTHYTIKNISYLKTSKKYSQHDLATGAWTIPVTTASKTRITVSRGDKSDGSSSVDNTEKKSRRSSKIISSLFSRLKNRVDN